MATYPHLTLFICLYLSDNQWFVKSEDYRVSLMYPSSYRGVHPVHYFGAFYSAINKANNKLLVDGWNITLKPSLDDTYQQTDNDGKVTGYNNLDSQSQRDETFRIMHRRRIDGYDALFGPSLELCSCQASLAGAFNVPLLGYVSLMYYYIDNLLIGAVKVKFSSILDIKICDFQM